MSGKPLYHWTPARNVDSITKRGLKVGMPSRDGMWKSPYISLSDSPSTAWNLSVALQSEETEWALFMTWTQFCTKLKKRKDAREWKCYSTIKKVWLVGVRSFKPRRNKTKKSSCQSNQKSKNFVSPRT